MARKRKILYAEDDAVTRDYSVEIFLEILPEFEIESFKDGISLDNRLEKSVKDVAAIITDNEMPGFSGSSLIKKNAKKDKFRKIPFILLYGGEDSIGREALFNGAFTYARKPFNLFSFESCVKRAIDFFKNY